LRHVVQSINRDRVRDLKLARARATQLAEVRAQAELFTDRFRERANVSSGRANHAHKQIAGAVVVSFQQRPVARERFELAHGDARGFSFDLFSAPRELVKLFPGNLFRRIHRRGLLNLAAQRSEG